MNLVGSSNSLRPLFNAIWLLCCNVEGSAYPKEIWSAMLDSGIILNGSKWEWKLRTTVKGTPSLCSTMKPTVTSSGSRMFSPVATNSPFSTMGFIFSTKGRLRQNPAPPVANQKETFFLSFLVMTSSGLGMEGLPKYHSLLWSKWPSFATKAGTLT